MTTSDPTNARLRDFDIPVIMPRLPLIGVPDFDEAVSTADLNSYRSAGQQGEQGQGDQQTASR